MQEYIQIFERSFEENEEFICSSKADISLNNKKSRETILISNMKLAIMFSNEEYYIVKHQNLRNWQKINGRIVISLLSQNSSNFEDDITIVLSNCDEIEEIDELSIAIKHHRFVDPLPSSQNNIEKCMKYILEGEIDNALKLLNNKLINQEVLSGVTDVLFIKSYILKGCPDLAINHVNNLINRAFEYAPELALKYIIDFDWLDVSLDSNLLVEEDFEPIYYNILEAIDFKKVGNDAYFVNYYCTALIHYFLITKDIINTINLTLDLIHKYLNEENYRIIKDVADSIVMCLKHEARNIEKEENTAEFKVFQNIIDQIMMYFEETEDFFKKESNLIDLNSVIILPINRYRKLLHKKEYDKILALSTQEVNINLPSEFCLYSLYAIQTYNKKQMICLDYIYKSYVLTERGYTKSSITQMLKVLHDDYPMIENFFLQLGWYEPLVLLHIALIKLEKRDGNYENSNKIIRRLKLLLGRKFGLRSEYYLYNIHDILDTSIGQKSFSSKN